MPSSIQIDSHQHFWSYDEQQYRWIPKGSPLKAPSQTQEQVANFWCRFAEVHEVFRFSSVATLNSLKSE